MRGKDSEVWQTGEEEPNAIFRRQLAAVASNWRFCSAGHSQADHENDHQHRGGSGGSVREEVNKDVIQTHAQEYGTEGWFEPVTKETWP